MLKNKLMIGSVLSAALIAATPIASAADNYTVEGNQIYHEDFNDLDTSKWEVYDRDHDDEYYGAYTDEAAHVDDGVLTISSRRHCVLDGQKRDDSNASEKPCPEGTQTQYSTGRVEHPAAFSTSKSFRIDMRAKLNLNGKKHNQPALWIKNNDTSYCQKSDSEHVGEFDLFENYGDPYHSNSAAISDCYTQNQGGEDKSFTKGSYSKFPSGVINIADDNWHEWSMIYDKENKTVEFLVDGKPVPQYKYWDTGKTTSGSMTKDLSKSGSKIKLDENHGLSDAEIDEMMSAPFDIILNDSIKRGDIDPQEDYPEQTFSIDDVSVETFGGQVYTDSSDKKEKVGGGSSLSSR